MKRSDAADRQRGRAFYLRQLYEAATREKVEQRRQLQRRVERRAYQYQRLVEATELEKELEARRCKVCDLLRAEAWGLGHANWTERKCGRCWAQHAEARAAQRHSLDLGIVATAGAPAAAAAAGNTAVGASLPRAAAVASRQPRGHVVHYLHTGKVAWPRSASRAAATTAETARSSGAGRDVSEEVLDMSPSRLFGGIPLGRVDEVIAALRARDADRLMQLLDDRALARHFGGLQRGAARGEPHRGQQPQPHLAPPPEEPYGSYYYHDAVLTQLDGGRGPESLSSLDGSADGKPATSSVLADEGGSRGQGQEHEREREGERGLPHGVQRSDAGVTAVRGGRRGRQRSDGEDGEQEREVGRGRSVQRQAQQQDHRRGYQQQPHRRSAATARQARAGAVPRTPGARTSSSGTELSFSAATGGQGEGQAGAGNSEAAVAAAVATATAPPPPDQYATGQQRPGEGRPGLPAGGPAEPHRDPAAARVAGYAPEPRPLPSKSLSVPGDEAELEAALRGAERLVVFGATQRARSEALFYSHQLRVALADLRLLRRRGLRAEAACRHRVRLDTGDGEGIERIIREGRTERPLSPTALRRIAQPDSAYVDPPRRTPRWLEHVHPDRPDPTRAVDPVAWRPPSARVPLPSHTTGLQSAGDWSEYRYEWELAQIRAMRLDDYRSLMRRERDFRAAWAEAKAHARSGSFPGRSRPPHAGQAREDDEDEEADGGALSRSDAAA